MRVEKPSGPGGPDTARPPSGHPGEVPDLFDDVLRAVECVPPGRLVSYGDIAALVGTGPRQVGRVMAQAGGGAAWWRVTNARGELPVHLREEASRQWRAEGIPVRPSGGARIDLARADLRELADAYDRSGEPDRADNGSTGQNGRVLELYIDLFRGLPRFAPGSDALTLEALERVGAPPADGLIADMGCGEGSSALVLARNTPCSIVAFDLEPSYVAGLRDLAEQAGLGDRIKAVVADVGEAPLEPGSVDLIWAEGSVYNLGFGQGLATWRKHLKEGGGIVVSELTWLSEQHGEKAEQFFAEAYPAMTTIDANVTAMREAGYDVLETIVFPASAWEDEFYTPLERSFPAYLRRHGHTKDAQEVVSVVRTEIETFRECGDCYSYVFYLGRAA